MKNEAIKNLQDIREKIDTLCNEAKEIVDQNFPEQSGYCDSYRIFEMTDSSNRYDTTVATFICDLTQMYDEKYLEEV